MLLDSSLICPLACNSHVEIFCNSISHRSQACFKSETSQGAAACWGFKTHIHLILRLQPHTRPTKHPLDEAGRCLHYDIIFSAAANAKQPQKPPAQATCFQAPARTGQLDCFETSAKMSTGNFNHQVAEGNLVCDDTLIDTWMMINQTACHSQDGSHLIHSHSETFSEITNHVILEYLLQLSLTSTRSLKFSTGNWSDSPTIFGVPVAIMWFGSTLW